MTYESGWIPRNYDEDPVGSCAAAYSGERVSMDDWPDLIDYQSRNVCSAWHVHKYNRVPVLNQGRFKYCWAYAVIAGVMNRYAFQGLNNPVDELSATAVAAQGKNYRNVGGHCSQAIAYAEKYGIPEAKYWPNNSKDKSYARDDEVKRSAKETNGVEYEDCGDDFVAAISAMLTTNLPVAFAIPRWRHAVLGLRLYCKNPRRPRSLGSYRLDFVNSYGNKHGQAGYGHIVGDTMLGQEHIVIKSVKVKQDDK